MTPTGDLIDGADLDVTAAVTARALTANAPIEISLTGGPTVTPQTVTLNATDTSMTVTFSALAAGSYTLTATEDATKYNLIITPATASITVGSPVPVPEVTITPRLGGDNLEDLSVDVQVTMDAIVDNAESIAVNLTGPDSRTDSVSFAVGRAAGTDALTVLFEDLASGNYTLAAVATPGNVDIVYAGGSQAIKICNFATATGSEDCDGDGVIDSLDVDDDDDGLIEIRSMGDLGNIRNDLDGHSLHNGTSGDTTGAPDDSDHAARPTVCDVRAATDIWLCGYELPGDLALSGDFTPIAGDFAAIFEGNNNMISGLNISVSIRSAGLFQSIGTDGWVRDLTLASATVTTSATGGASNAVDAGALAAISIGRIVNVHVDSSSTVSTTSTASSISDVGGLVGDVRAGSRIAASSSAATVTGSGTTADVGGLLGTNFNGTIVSSYATGTVNGGAGSAGDVGGLVGNNFDGTIVSSYATGEVNGDGGGTDRVGGLVGLNGGTSGTHPDSRIVASYAIGATYGGDGAAGGGNDNDIVGGLVGRNSGVIDASYATGNVTSDVSAGSEAVETGQLVGISTVATVTASYGFGTTTPTGTGGSVVNRSTDATAAGTVATAGAITQANSSNGGTDWSTRVWRFGTSDGPALNWITGYDSSGSSDAAIYPCVSTSDLLPAGATCLAVLPGQPGNR